MKGDLMESLFSSLIYSVFEDIQIKSHMKMELEYLIDNLKMFAS